jgi:glutathione peroxidase
MRLFSLLSLGVFMSLAAFGANSVHEFTMKSIDGNESSLAAYRGKVMLIVNVASKCGYTRQYSGLEALYQKYKGQGLVIVGVPANNFGGQEPGSDAEIQQFCSRTYGVSFPMLSKVSVKGDDQTPLYAFLTDKNEHPETGGDVRWNFTKFLVDGNGKVIGRFESKVEPDSAELVQAVEKALASGK